MIGDPSKLMTINWSVIRDETEAYVREFTDGQLSLTFGPMPVGVVECFVRERQATVKALFDQVILKLETQTNGFQNPPQEAEPISD
jgi:hypothetical protein